ncbi:hypothetical protein SULI_07700 [Saccharolobus solfataricus]|uniref:Uncharacterized protein n=3 Tax=Saccharolobus solfataricus TaxID=2287 RepID=Q7LXX0_SACS2|nr:hypothetical protein [Saccharolobus solfataricus]AAK40839.1 Hypothetical protein SSO0521 [Saccharolobus solfataricus P2]AKA73808.1 hypothetical protein SULB_1544 [Saccharolobus solfataricus]AKA76505.1 hypothetical protein SULC_1542 [Saccharolobus solfataricus]AKA79198.1 hypothetical protein SULA_1543 [Saccharolobus solfataricus]AZF68284.1 hypothetical protein SULG_07700 [Saccharolobus solfataricus]
MKRSIVLLSMVSIVLIVLGGYLFAIDKPTVVYPEIKGQIITETGVPNAYWWGYPAIIVTPQELAQLKQLAPHIVPPPWYATLWPIPLVGGIVGLIYSVVRLLKK